MAERTIKSVNLLPEFFRTEKNSKFLSSTLDQLIQPPSLERLDGYIGSKLTPNYDSSNDVYVGESTELRENYQLEPALVVKDNLSVVKDVVGIDDLTNQVGIHNGTLDNFNKLYNPQFYSFNPHIDLDKFVNYQQYYWLVNGPDVVTITGQQLNSTSTFTVTDNDLETSFVFSPDGLTEDPLVILYRGNTYKFEIDSVYNFYIKTEPSLGATHQYYNNVTNNGTSTGVITFSVDQFTPNILFYSSGEQTLSQGRIVIKTIAEDSRIDVEQEIIGKKYYQSGTGVVLSNGMKIRFGGEVFPEFYQNKMFYVEGVGTNIKLVNSEDLVVAESIAEKHKEYFDSDPFDSYAFDSTTRLPIAPEYITINRASLDLNPWTRYNRWVHQEVIAKSAEANNIQPIYPADLRARRPIVEFKANLKLYNFGTRSVGNVDLVDTITLDAFSLVEGSAGHHVDGILLEQGYRVIFAADEDDLVRNKIYEVNFVTINGKQRLELNLVDEPAESSCVYVLNGNDYAGTSWWFNGTDWKLSQQHTSLNQAPLFDLFDESGVSYSDAGQKSSFTGNKVFGYEVGTGTNDPILGFPLKYRNSSGVGSYLFKNYFSNDEISLAVSYDQTLIIPTSQCYLKFANQDGDTFVNVWQLSEPYHIPIIEVKDIINSTTTVELTCLDRPDQADFTLEVFVKNPKESYQKISSDRYNISFTGEQCFIQFDYTIDQYDTILFKVYTEQAPNTNGYYEPPLGLTNNPLNDTNQSLTLSEVSDHLGTMVNRLIEFEGQFPGSSNLRDLSSIERFGTRLISNINPISFAQFFIGKKEHDVIASLDLAADQYNQFKLSFLTHLKDVDEQFSSRDAVDYILKTMNLNKDTLSPYYYSDMVAYGTDKITKTFTVINTNNTIYPITSDFRLNELSNRSVLVYLNDQQLVNGSEYRFVEYDSSIEFLIPLAIDDIIVIDDYTSTLGCFVPSTPTKLGLYPKYQPRIFEDTSYIEPVNVIQAHDGSLIKAYDDYRDDIILELEKRIYNNIKVEYRPELLDCNLTNVGAFRTNKFTSEQLEKIINRDFIKWTASYGINPYDNSAFDEADAFTYNFSNAYCAELEVNLKGSWRAVYKFLYDTDRPNFAPWEMLGFSEQPTWWEDEYGPGPYTSGNEILWQDLEDGRIRQGSRSGIHEFYARPGLLNLIPVDENGDLIDPTDYIASNITLYNRRQNWIFGDQGPAETAWRRSSYWPFVVQKLLALTSPSDFSALMFDTSRVHKNLADQWVYGENNKFLDLRSLKLYTNDLAAGYGVFVIEQGLQRNRNYLNELQDNLNYVDFNLFYKVGGFVSKDKTQIIIDAIDPVSSSPGAILPQEDYDLILNVSNPIRSSSISGVIVQKQNGKFLVKGYDTKNPYFTMYKPFRSSTSPAITVGGISESYQVWREGGSENINRQLSAGELTTANSISSGIYYEKGQIVLYQNSFYRVKVAHKSGSSFVSDYFQRLPSLPVKNGVTVQTITRFENIVETIPYGTEFSKVQEVYDLLVGYGAWLQDQGFIFDQFNTDLNSTIDWDYTAKEFLYWTTQNWAQNSVITLAPFADRIKFKLPNSVVDDIFNGFYDYSLLQANGIPFNKNNINVNREDGVCTIATASTTEGIYFARLNSVQKEHAIVFNNTTMFNDTIYDIVSGYRQRRMKVVGFRTKSWDGDYFSPGFVYDVAHISDWESYKSYKAGDIVKFSSKYYTAKSNLTGTERFDFTEWVLLGSRPVANLLPNFDYKINQFEDFYSLDIDNFDAAQQKMAQHLIGYTPRTYLNNIFTNPISQYKFYQGFIREKGTKNSVIKLAKASLHNLQGEIDYTEEWAFRIGHFGSFETYKEHEIPLREGAFIENPQVINFVDTIPVKPNDLIYYTSATDRLITPTDYVAANTFVTTSSLDLFKLQTAGYVRFDDVDVTALNENSILDLQNNRQLQDGDVVWVASKENNDWDVLRYNLMPARITSSFMDAVTPDQMTFVTRGLHNLSVGDLISISQFEDTIDGIYKVINIPKLNQFTVNYDSASFISSINPDSYGLLFKFVTARFNTFNELTSDTELLKLPKNSKFWIDNFKKDDGIWSVYEKIQNYNTKSFNSFNTPDDQKLGYKITRTHNKGYFFVAAPGYVSASNTGTVIAYTDQNGSVNQRFRFGINYGTNTFYNNNDETDFGQSIVYDDREFNDTGYGLIFVGAPATSRTKSNDSIGGVRYADDADSASIRTQEGLVTVSSIDPLLIDEVRQRVLLSPNPSSYERFGQSLFRSGNYFFVGAPSISSVGTGTVYAYYVDSSSNTVDFTYLRSITTSTVSTSSRWGSVIHGAVDASTIVIGAPGYLNNSGLVCFYTGTNTTYTQTITSPFGTNSKFGEELKVSNNGDYVFVSAPDARSRDQSYGKVAVYKRLDNSYTLLQTIVNPVPTVGMKFGQAIDVNADATELVITAVGLNKHVPLTFDTYSELLTGYENDPTSDLTDSATTFDSDSTNFFDSVVFSGSSYIYNRKTDYFRLADELGPVDFNTGTNYGYSVAMNDDSIYVGAPAFRNYQQPDDARSAFYQFYKKDTNSTSLNLYRQKDDTVDVSTLRRIILLDSFNEEIVDYLDVIDPLKGKIAGIAEQDLRYKSSFDPAIYSIGTDNTVNDVNTNWTDAHIGDLWWDLSTAKYVVYEQGDLTYRKNNWGKLFPGSTIDVYEWVASELLPSEWAAQADTPEGLTQGISGQPKYPDNTVLSVKQVYNPLNGAFINIYYFWVKNKITVPDVKNRRLSSYQVSSIIENPTLFGLRYASVIDSDAIALSNVGNLLTGDRINLNFSTDIIDSSIPKHTEWLLLQENSANSVPNVLLEKKFFDSLLGHDSLGNPVPDPSLSERERYGIQIRPRQTMFKDRFEALRNIIEYANSVLINERIVGTYSLKTLNKQESIPDPYSREYDQIVEDNEGLLLIDTRNFAQAELSCTVLNGKIRAVNIINGGFGYKQPPLITIADNSGAELQTSINDQGQVVSVEIINPGLGFSTAPTLTVRSYTVVVQSDSTYNGKWAMYVYDLDTESWVRARTQQYNTPLYWDKVDWVSENYNQFVDLKYTIDELYQLDTLEDIQTGDYVKVRDAGLGTYIILEKATAVGTYGNGYNIVYAENGTIQIKDSVWDFTGSIVAFDNGNSFDQTLYDQTPDKELEYILTALKTDLFVNELKIHWNAVFFKAVKYVFQEQKLVDWAFKTSFINVTNFAGALDQRPIYKLQNSSYYEDYLKEVKPYHTQIRNFVTNYSPLEDASLYTTDFDLPAVYDPTTNKFRNVEIGDEELNTYPWKSWGDNFTYGVGSITVSLGGTGYTERPSVEIVAQTGDTGSGATAEAYIRSGEVVEFVVTNSGTGYKVPPIVYIIGGGAGVTKTAIGYAQLANNKVRELTVGIKFDRTSRAPEIQTLDTVDRFICNGSDFEFVLTWLALPDKNLIDVTLDGNLVLSSDYKLEYFENYLGLEEYSKKYCKIVFLNYVPLPGQVVVVSYHKDIDLLNAVDRIVNYYNPTTGMPGSDLAQLMEGIEYPRTRIEGLMFDYTTKWGINWTLRDRAGNESTTSSYGISSWADDIGFYKSIKIISTATAGTDTLVLSTTTGVVVGQFVNIVSASHELTTATMFYDQLQFSQTGIKVEQVYTSSNSVKFSSTITNDLTATSQITLVNGALTTITNIGSVEFWSYDTNTTILDSAIDGGSWTTGTRVAALGINPEDISIVGDSFISSNTSYAPEELVPGEINESVGINVYTKNPEGAPIIVSGMIDIQANTTATRRLSIVPPNYASVRVVFNGQILTYSTIFGFPDNTTYTIDWETNELLIPPQPVDGTLGYTVVGIGGGVPGLEAGVIDSATLTVITNNSLDEYTSTQIQSLAILDTVKSAYVTVNGQSIPAVNTTTSYGFMLSATNIDNNRAAVNVYNLPDGENTITAWFFGTANKYFNEITEQVFTWSTTTNTFVLSSPPGVIEPASTQMIVDLIDDKGRRQLTPPHVDYYEVSNIAITSYLINNTGTFDNTNTNVFVNGKAIDRNSDYMVSGNTVSISYPLATHDVIAIEGIPTDNIDYDFVYTTSTITLTSLATTSTGELHVITFNNHDDMLIRTERFNGIANRRYKISRPALNDDYVWVRVNGIPLINHRDYELLDDMVTVQVSDEFEHSETDDIVITTVSSSELATTILGYRIFNDIFNRTHFKRLSKQNTTYLTKELYFTDTEIHVADASVLPTPIPSKNIPGVILVDGERIEYFKVNGNVLSQLRRSTLGTAPSFYSETMTKVIDQGPDQTVPFTESIKRQDMLTVYGQTEYTIVPDDHVVLLDLSGHRDYVAGTEIEHKFANDGIVISTTINPEDQIAVYYGGRPLRKTGIFTHDIDQSFDSPILTSVNSTATLSGLPLTEVLGTAYIVTATNEVWVYTKSNRSEAVNGYEFTGLRYLEPEFTVNTLTNKIVLNIEEGVQTGIKLTLIKREFARAAVWNNEVTTSTTLSLMESTTTPAKFLQARPAELPDKYYYGGDPALTEDSGFAVTNENNEPLEGY